MHDNRLGMCVILLLVSIWQAAGQELPIRAARTIRFTTHEGSYMSVDVSPDGRTLVFDLLGDLYTLPVSGGEARQLTRGIGLHLRPVWSPDGRKIAYMSDASGAFHVHVRDVSGTFHCILGRTEGQVNMNNDTPDALWLPGGRYIIFGGTVYGLEGASLPMRQSRIPQPVRFSADGKLAYYLDSGRLYRYDAVSGIRTGLTAVPRGAVNMTVSGDGRWLAYMKDTSGFRRCLVVRDVVNHTDRVLVASLYKDTSAYALWTPLLHYTFSPDGRSIFIGYGGHIHRLAVEGGGDEEIPFTARVQSDLGAYNYNTFRVGHAPVPVRYTRSAHESPDGRQLVFSALGRVYVMALPGGRAQVLAPQAAGQFQPVYSPDGRWVAYVSWSDTAGGALWRVPAVGGQPEQLSTEAGQYQHPAWSPDGQYIAVVKGPAEPHGYKEMIRGRLEVISVGDRRERVIDESVPVLNQPAFSADGSRIIYEPVTTMAKSSPELVSRDREGKDLRVLSVGLPVDCIEQRQLSPDGRFILYCGGEDLYLVPVCVLTGPQVLNDGLGKLSVIRFARGGVDPYWSKGGREICWTYGNHFYRVSVEKILSAAEGRVMQSNAVDAPEGCYITAIVSPDATIPLQVTVPASYGHGVIALKDVRIITMEGGRVIDHGTVVIRDGRFAAVGPSGGVRIPVGAKVLDLAGATVIPGLIDLHLHMHIFDFFPLESWVLPVNLAYGVTTARDPASNYESFGYKELLETGQLTGPRLYTVGEAARYPDGMIRFDNIADTRSFVNKHKLLGAVTIKQYVLPTRMQREWLLLSSREAGLNMTNEKEDDPRLMLGQIKDGSTGIEHNPKWGEVYDDVLRLLSASHTCLTPTLQICDGAEEGKEYFNHMYWHVPDAKLRRFTPDKHFGGVESIEDIVQAHPRDTVHPGFLGPAAIDARIRRLGGYVTVGAHGNDEGIGTQNELWALQMGGFSNMEALEAGTILAARALGMERDLGSIAVGKIADLVILNRNPLEDIHNSREIRYVIKDGKLYNGDTLEMLWPEVKPGPQWRLKGSGE